MEKKRGNEMTGREYKDGGNSRGDGKGEKRGTGMRLVEIVEEEIIRAEKIKAEII